MKILRLRILLILALILAALYPLASYTAHMTCDDHGHVEVTGLDKVAHLLRLDEWLERLEDGWIPLFFLEDEELVQDHD